MIRFFHTADIHFGMENYGKIDPATGIHTRLLDFKKSLEQCIDKAIEENIDFFLFCGDAYKTAYPTPTQQKLLMELFFKLYKAGIPVVIIVGNHDHPLSFGKATALDVFGNLPVDGFHVFSKPDILRLATKNGVVQIVGIPWPMRHHLVTKEDHRFKNSQEITEYLSGKVGQIISHFAEQLDPSLPAVLASHLTVSSGIFSGSEKCAVFGTDPVLLPSQLAIKPFDYVALGHLHRHQDLNPQGYPPIVYAGSIERVDFGERKEPKGYCSVTIEGGEQKKSFYSFVPLTIRPMIQIDVHLAEGKDQTEQLLAAIEKYDINDALLKIVYYIPQGKKDTVDLSVIQRACAAAHYIAGIIPIHEQPVREKRLSMKVTMSFTDLLDKYLQAKNLAQNQKEQLIKKAVELYEDVQNSQQEDSADSEH